MEDNLVISYRINFLFILSRLVYFGTPKQMDLLEFSSLHTVVKDGSVISINNT